MDGGVGPGGDHAGLDLGAGGDAARDDAGGRPSETRFGGTTPRAGSLASIDAATGTVLPIAALPICPAETRLWPDGP